METKTGGWGMVEDLKVTSLDFIYVYFSFFFSFRPTTSLLQVSEAILKMF